MQEHFDGIQLTSGEFLLNQILPVLQWLDQLLKQAIATAPLIFGAELGDDPYQGLHLELADIQRRLARPPGEPLFQTQAETPDRLIDTLDTNTRLIWLKQTYGLSAFDLEVVAIALAPEIDRRYEQVYAYLQDDIRRHRPSVDLALNLLCSSAAERLVRCNHFSSDAPLMRQALLQLLPENPQEPSTLLASSLKLTDAIIRFLLGRTGLDPQLYPCCTLVKPASTLQERLMGNHLKAGLLPLVQQAQTAGNALYLYFEGPSQIEKRHVAESLADDVGAPLLIVNLAPAVGSKLDFDIVLRLAFHEAQLQNAILYIDNLDTLRLSEHKLAYHCFLSLLSDEKRRVILSGKQRWVPEELAPPGVLPISFPVPEFTQRLTYWQNTLQGIGLTLPPSELAALAERFRLTHAQIAEAVSIACHQAQWRIASQLEDSSPTELAEALPLPTLSDLFAAARAQSGHELQELAQKINPKYGWEDIVLSADSSAQLQEICNQVKYRYQVYGEWGFDDKLSRGKGLNVLFSGPPGTGKTMAAEVVAHELQVELYKIDLSRIVSKYIGETEKNLDRIFVAAETANAILFFDEADALFGKRSEVRDAHDRYANIEISYLLQKMEEYDGVVMLATNLRKNLDDAFVRRIHFMLDFPFPDPKKRRRIWQKIWPDAVPLSSDIDFDFLARQFELTGGSIRNIALASAFLAADDGGKLSMKHLMRAIRREYKKMGKVLTEGAFGQYANLQ
ncbi:MAG: ATP-binding protein [Leptolyngbyaceae cyanobacterium MO_188.B28]|nr:ATP-binding protein [Leptolyngbyaceae cyanobacterium MO_188.B28]